MNIGMSISMYHASVPVLARALKNLRLILEKAEAHAQAKKIDATVFLGARLAPDMLSLTRQVQLASDSAKGGAARLAGVAVPSYADVESTFAELYARLDKTIAFLNGFTPAQVDGSENRDVSLPLPGGGSLEFKGQGYLLGFLLPNFFFHVVTAYDILRMQGVELSKRDYLGPPQ